MKKSAFFLAALCSGSLLVTSCNSDKTADTTATTIETTTTDASGDMAGMDHSKMADGSMAGDSPMMASMNDMMGKIEARLKGEGFLFPTKDAARRARAKMREEGAAGHCNA